MRFSRRLRYCLQQAAETTAAAAETTTEATAAADSEEEDDTDWLGDDDDDSGDSDESGDGGSKTSGSGFPYDASLGTAKEPDGNIAVASVFINTMNMVSRRNMLTISAKTVLMTLCATVTARLPEAPFMTV